MFDPDIFIKALISLEDKCMAMVNKTLLQLDLPAPVWKIQDLLHAEYIQEKNFNVEELCACFSYKNQIINQDQKKYTNYHGSCNETTIYYITPPQIPHPTHTQYSKYSIP